MNPEVPIFVFDDDDWLDIFPTWDAFVGSVEWPTVEENVLIVDAGGNGILAEAVDEDSGRFLPGGMVPQRELLEAVRRNSVRWRGVRRGRLQ